MSSLEAETLRRLARIVTRGMNTATAAVLLTNADMTVIVPITITSAV